MSSKAKLFSFWDDIRSSYWFVPTLMASAAVLLSQLSLFFDRSNFSDALLENRLLYTGSAEGARLILSTIASSMIALAGVVFSITMVTLALASKQFGPRLLRNFMRDRGNQVVLGTFVSAFLFCLLVLRQLQGEDAPASDKFIPQISMLLAVAFAIAGLGVLIYYIHHISASIQTQNILKELSKELKQNVKNLYPHKIGQSHADATIQNARDAELSAKFEHIKNQTPQAVCARQDGYIRRIDPELLMKNAERFDLVIWSEHRPGDFVNEYDPVFWVWPSDRTNPSVLKALSETFQIGHQRTQEQDTRYTIEQLVGIALIALSPSGNDPFTAIQCLNHLGASLVTVAQRQIPAGFRVDKNGRLRLITQVYDFDALVALSFDQIRCHSKNEPAVLEALLETLYEVARHAVRVEDKESLLRQGEMARELALKSANMLYDRKKIEVRYLKLFQAAETHPGKLGVGLTTA